MLKINCKKKETRPPLSVTKNSSPRHTLVNMAAKIEDDVSLDDDNNIEEGDNNGGES